MLSSFLARLKVMCRTQNTTICRTTTSNSRLSVITWQAAQSHKIIVKETVMLLPPSLSLLWQFVLWTSSLTSVVVIYVLGMYIESPKRTSDHETLSSAIDSSCKTFLLLTETLSLTFQHMLLYKKAKFLLNRCSENSRQTAALQISYLPKYTHKHLNK